MEKVDCMIFLEWNVSLNDGFSFPNAGKTIELP